MGNNFIRGDVVYLKSGGPAMTVQGEHENFTTKEKDGRIATRWHNGEKFMHEAFYPDMLTKTKPE